MKRLLIAFAIVAKLTGCGIHNSPNSTQTNNVPVNVALMPPYEQQLPLNAR